jgi:TPR repeat protein
VQPVIASPAPAPEPSKPARPTPADQLVDAERAVTAQRYADAIAILKPLADGSNAKAEEKLGDLYAQGHGVERDLKAAARWYEKAAEQGNVGAQVKTGDAYASGAGVIQSNYLAYVWYSAAARLGAKEAEPKRDKSAAMLQPAELKQADRLIDNIIDGIRKKA